MWGSSTVFPLYPSRLVTNIVELAVRGRWKEEESKQNCVLKLILKQSHNVMDGTLCPFRISCQQSPFKG